MQVTELLELVNRVNSVLLALMIILVLALAVLLFGFPREAVMIFAGYQFGMMIGLLVNQLGMFIGASFGYLIGKRGRIQIENGSKKIYMRYQKAFEENGVKALALVRLTPLSPQDTVSMISGFIKFNPKSYFMVSFVSFLPYTILWSFVGEEFFERIISLIPSDYNLSIWIYGFVFSILIITLFVKVFLKVNKENNEINLSEETAILA